MKLMKLRFQKLGKDPTMNFSDKIKYTVPEGGLLIWCTLPEGYDMMSFCKRAVEEDKVAVVPGTAFTVIETDKTTSFRLNF